MKPVLAVILGIALLGCAVVLEDSPGLSDLVRDLIRRSGAEVAVAFRTLDGERELLIKADESFHAASTMKIPVMFELFRRDAAGELSLEDSLPVTNEFRSIVDGSTFTLSPEDDSDTEIYSRVGDSLTLRDLCERMITVSSNLAANLLIVKLGADRIQETVKELGAPGMQVRRCLEDGKAYRRGVSNTTTARALLKLLESLGRHEVVSSRASREMIDILSRQQFNEGIPAGVPPGVKIAHKTGQITAVHHDAGLVLGLRPYVLVVLVRGLEDDSRSARLIADISRQCWRFATGDSPASN